MAKKKNSGKKELPKFLPFKTVAELLAFEEISQEDYNDVVDYLEYLGGYNAHDAAAIYLKQCFQPTADLVEKVTWLGSRKNGISALKDTRFVQACEGKNNLFICRAFPCKSLSRNQYNFCTYT
ncbi:uncharacterized protein LOC116418362 [Nasonia vitripennis]|uniref:Uncharacterized protein n=1 Tax=Nasonia vitripennis TaxID=7425 RepID=A0A7M7QQE3_NASVI|nr:uncharacterized protein LOC116418362 [Nasonia vitripennis]